MVAPARQARRLAALFAGFGYVENFAVSTATANAELQFVRPCGHEGGPGADAARADDHIDVFLDTFHMDHDIDLATNLKRVAGGAATCRMWHGELDGQE